jgi:hypothetical protein
MSPNVPVSGDLNNEAEVLAVSLEIGAVSVADVVEWADARVAIEDHPHWSVCEVATMGASYEPDVARALREVPGVVDETRVRHELVCRLARALVEDRTRGSELMPGPSLRFRAASQPQRRNPIGESHRLR